MWTNYEDVQVMKQGQLDAFEVFVTVQANEVSRAGRKQLSRVAVPAALTRGNRVPGGAEEGTTGRGAG